MSREPLETPDPRDPATYKVWESYPLRFIDQDLMQHVNNVVFSRLFESSRIEFWRGLGQFPFPKESGLIMVRGAIDYLRQLHYPDTVRIGTRIKHIGTSSLRVRQALFNGKGECCALSESVSAHAHYASSKSSPIPDKLRKILESA